MNKALAWFKNGLVVVMVLIVAATAISNFGIHFPSFPFNEKTVDKSQDPIALQLKGIQEFHGSRGTFSVIVDLEKDTAYVPSFLLGTKATMAATGTIDTSVDFSLARVDADENQVTVWLPAPVLMPVALDQTKTSIVARERGLLDRLTGVFKDSPTNDQGLYIAATTKIAAAAENTNLVGMAKETTSLMVTALVAPRTARILWDDDPNSYGPLRPNVVVATTTKEK